MGIHNLIQKIETMNMNPALAAYKRCLIAIINKPSPDDPDYTEIVNELHNRANAAWFNLTADERNELTGY